MTEQTSHRVEISEEDLELEVAVASAFSAGNFAKALETTRLIKHSYPRIDSLLKIVIAQAGAGSVADAKKT